MSFPPGTEMFHFPGFASLAGWLLRAGFPHSEIHGSKPVRSSPQLIAAYHVLHRLSTPRHPPNALLALDRSHYRCPSNPSGSYATDERPVSKIIHLPAVRHRNQRQKARPVPELQSRTGQASRRPRQDRFPRPDGQLFSSRCQIERATPRSVHAPGTGETGLLTRQG